MPSAEWSQFNPAWWEARVDEGRWRLSCSTTSWSVQENFVGIYESAGPLPPRIHTSITHVLTRTPVTDIVHNMEAAERWLIGWCEQRYLNARTLRP